MIAGSAIACSSEGQIALKLIWSFEDIVGCQHTQTRDPTFSNTHCPIYNTVAHNG
jgi:hypothetical protein